MFTTQSLGLNFSQIVDSQKPGLIDEPVKTSQTESCTELVIAAAVKSIGHHGNRTPPHKNKLAKLRRHASRVHFAKIHFGKIDFKHRKNCECCHHHSLFKGHNVNVNIVVLNCQK